LTEIECEYGQTTYAVLGNIYQCEVANDPNIINSESTEITALTGDSQFQNMDGDVYAFRAVGKTIKYFPKDLNNFFNNLKAIHIENCKLQKIRQTDLKPFVDLVYLFFGFNDIEVIGPYTFKYNPNLEVLAFRESKIVHIENYNFDNLKKLTNFWFKELPCSDKDVYDSRRYAKLEATLTQIKCMNWKYIYFHERIDKLEDELRTFYGNLTAFETDLETDSQLRDIRTLKSRLNKLRTLKLPE